MIRRRLRYANTGNTLLEPRYYREEGRLAALAGDVPGAIMAYQRFLALRTDPDPGLVADEVELVRSELAKLLPDAVGTN